jgi:hypothetical protein
MSREVRSRLFFMTVARLSGEALCERVGPAAADDVCRK